MNLHYSCFKILFVIKLYPGNLFIGNLFFLFFISDGVIGLVVSDTSNCNNSNS